MADVMRNHVPGYEATVAGLRARTDLPPFAAAAVSLLLWHESWLRREDFRRACLITNPAGIHWTAVREFCDSNPPGASTSQLTVLEVALAIVEDQFKFRHLGHAHRRAVAEAFAAALGQELTPAVPQHNHRVTAAQTDPGPYSIGSAHWPGLAKAAEECGELIQVAGKIIAANGASQHWDGSNLRERLEGEIGDVLAALDFLIDANGLDRPQIRKQRESKYALFAHWHREKKDGSLNRDAS